MLCFDTCRANLPVFCFLTIVFVFILPVGLAAGYPEYPETAALLIVIFTRHFALVRKIENVNVIKRSDGD